MDLLEIIQTVCDELGLPQPSVITTSQDVGVRQLYALANREGRELQQTNDWTCLTALHVVDVGAAVQTTGTVSTGSKIITGIPSTADIVANTFTVSGDSIPVAARVASVDSATQVTMDMEATDDVVATALVFTKDTYAEPDDFDRFINETWWDRTNQWALLGPDSPQIDEWHRSGIVTVGPRRHFRQVGRAPNNYRIWPPIGTVENPFQLVFEYTSRNWVIAADGTTTKATFTEDTDSPILDYNAIIMGIKWRYWQIKGFDYAPMQAEYIDYVSRIQAQDGGAKTLSLTPRRRSILISPFNVQDGNFPAGPGDMS